MSRRADGSINQTPRRATGGFFFSGCVIAALRQLCVFGDIRKALRHSGFSDDGSTGWNIGFCLLDMVALGKSGTAIWNGAYRRLPIDDLRYCPGAR
jgi:hypothetical protein